MRRELGVLAVGLAMAIGCLGTPAALAQSGFCLIGCAKDSDYILNFKVQEKIHDFTTDRYWLWIGQQKTAVVEIQVIPDDSFDGEFDTGSLEVNGRTSGTSYKIEGTTWDKEQRALTVVLAKPIPAADEIEIIINRVHNPSAEGIYKLNARVLGTEPNPVYRYVGTWALTIE